MSGEKGDFVSSLLQKISGPSGCGKTSFAASFFRNAGELMEEEPRRICYFYQLYQPAFDQMKRELGSKIYFFEGMPDGESLENIVDSSPRPLILTFDDLSLEINEHIVNLFQVWSHHREVSIFLILQNFFGKSKNRDVSLSATHVGLFKSPRDKQTALNLGKQIYPGRASSFVKLFEEATREPHSYLILDLQQKTNDNLRLLSNILPEQRPVLCWIMD